MTTKQGKFLKAIRQRIWLVRYRLMDNFIFVHINKTGGSSVEHALKLPFEHITALEYIERLGRKTWDGKFTFTVVRNPWDKVVSHYHYRIQTNQTRLKEKPISFREWVRAAYGENDPEYYNNPKMFMPQIKWISDNDGNLLVNKICHFENLNEDIGEVARQLNKQVNLPHLKKSNRGDFREYYDDDTSDIIRRWFADDIRLFNYELS